MAYRTLGGAVRHVSSSRGKVVFLDLSHLDLPFYVTEDEDVPESMHLNQYPSTFIYARDGSIAAQHAGAGNWSDESVIQFIEQLRAQ